MMNPSLKRQLLRTFVQMMDDLKDKKEIEKRIVLNLSLPTPTVPSSTPTPSETPVPITLTPSGTPTPEIITPSETPTSTVTPTEPSTALP